MAELDAQKMASADLPLQEHIAELLPIGLYTCDAEGRITFFNQKAAEIWGRSPAIGEERFCGCHKAYLLDGTYVSPDETPMSVALRTGQSFRNEDVVVERPDGSRVVARVNIDPILSPEGDVVGVINAFLDVTATHSADERLRTSEREYRVSFELAAVGKAQADPKTFRFTRVNPKFCDMTGYSQEELLTMSFRDLTHPDDIGEDEVALADVLAGRTAYWQREKRYLSKSGQTLWVQVTGTVVRDDRDQPIRMLAVIQDVTANHELLTELRQSEERFRTLAEAIPQLIWACRGDGYCDFLSRQWCEYTGCEESEHWGAGWLSAIHPEDREATRRRWEQAIAGEAEYDIEYRLCRYDGLYRWFKTRGVMLRDENGVVTRVIGSCTDIHEQILANEALSESEAKFRVLAEAMPQLVWTGLPDGYIDYCNNRWLSYTGLTHDEVQGDGWASRVHPDDRESTFAEWTYATQTNTEYEIEQRLQSKDGEYRWFLARAHPLKDEAGRVVKWYGTCTDIDDYKRTVHALQESEERARLATDAGHVGTWDWDIREGTIRWSDRLQEFFGLQPGEFLGTSEDFAQRVLPEDRDRVHAQIQHSLETGDLFETDMRILRPDGTVRIITSNGQVIFDKSGEPCRMVGAAADVTEERLESERSRILLELDEATRFLEDPVEVLRQMVDILGETLQLSRCLYAELDLAAMEYNVVHEYPPHEPKHLGRNTLREVPETLKLLEAGTTIVIDDTSDHPLTAQWYESRYKPLGTIAIVSVPLHQEGRLVGLLTVNDNKPRRWQPHEVSLIKEVTERLWLTLQNVRAQQEVRRLNAELERRVEERTSEMQAAIRELEGFTYSVSHDLRAPLRAIVSSSMILLEDASPKLDQDEIQLLERQAQNARRLGDLIDELLKLSRIGRQEMTVVPFDMSELAADVVSEIHQKADCCTVDIEPGLEAKGDPKLVRFVLLNLIENACKFSPDGGAVSVGKVDGAFFVRDQGIGFDMQYADKLFLPFERLVRDDEFPGTGVGLANVRRIVERHGGRVWAESKLKHGATFYFTLPE